MADGRFSPEVAAAIVQRAGFRCERCGASCTGQRGVDWSVQHRMARGMGGTTRKPTTADGAVLCGSATTGCHGWVESHPTTATYQGWRVSQGGNVYNVPVKHFSWGWTFLDDDGCYVRVGGPGSAYEPASGQLTCLCGELLGHSFADDDIERLLDVHNAENHRES